LNCEHVFVTKQKGGTYKKKLVDFQNGTDFEGDKY